VLDFNSARVSVVATQVLGGREDEFLALVDELHGLIRQRGYGSDRLLQDGANPRLYYHVRTWTSVEAVEQCAGDTEVQTLWQRLDPTMKVVPLVGMAKPVLAWSAATRSTARPGDRRRLLDRRIGGDRRLLDLRFAGHDQRDTERRTRPERRIVAERRLGERRSSQERRLAVAYSGPDNRQGQRRSGVDRRLTIAHDATSQRNGSTTSIVTAARAARIRAVATYSGFRVGAALETADGSIVTGCNIENATYGLTLCAERVAMFKALSEGHRHFTRLALVADSRDPTAPCGACRQILWEFGGDLEVILANLTETRGTHRLKDLLPMPFDDRNLR
jgi:cytidine deaminase